MRALLVALILAFALPAQALDREALEQRVAEAPHDARAWLALGIERANAGELGASIAALEQGRVAAPRNREIEDALLVAHREARSRQAENAGAGGFIAGEPSEIRRWRFFTQFRTGVFAWLCLLGSWTAAAAAFGAARDPVGPRSRRDGLWVLACAAGLVALGAAAMWQGAARTTSAVSPAVVVDASPRWREAPDLLARPQRDVGLYEGAVVSALEIRSSWVHVSTAEGSSGWVKRGEVTTIATSRR